MAAATCFVSYAAPPLVRSPDRPLRSIRILAAANEGPRSALAPHILYPKPRLKPGCAGAGMFPAAILDRAESRIESR